jgi:hypothetical protein
VFTVDAGGCGEAVMGNRGPRLEQHAAARESEPAEHAIDATTILDNVVSLDRMLDEGSRRQLGELPYLELSKHLKIKKAD